MELEECREMNMYHLKILGLCKIKWTGTSITRLTNGNTIIHSGKKGQAHTHGVALCMAPEATRAVLFWEPVSPRILTARFNLKFRRVNAIQCYAHPNVTHIEVNTQGIEEKPTLQARYWEKNREVKKSARKDKRHLIKELTTKAEVSEDEQAGFRQDRSVTDHISTMRIIIEQSLELPAPLYAQFVDFQKAFDSVDQGLIWRLMYHYGFPSKFVTTIQQLYKDATCQFIHDVIEATSILDYEDTDVGSIRCSAANRQSPVGSGLPRSKSPSYTIHKQTVEVQLFDRPQSPVPNQASQINQAEKLPPEVDIDLN
ncbi:hypothetical protein EGW08_006969 [Elysia chlorotica]|uniref:Uncharacterized protein n=1 Tax=Elysia chlorotica TaxID=188477 RepID=A0A433TUV5_ELYCH|nr:hypothetical protein EGW08_006969 [Elysia chlorotica]